VVESEKKGIGESELCSWISEKMSEEAFETQRKSPKPRRGTVCHQVGRHRAFTLYPSQLTRTVAIRYL